MVPPGLPWFPSAVPPFVLFWLLLSGHFDPLLLALGAFSVVLVCWLTWRGQILEGRHLTLRWLVRLPGYLLWLGLEALRSAAAVVRLVWARHIDLHPVVEPTPLPPMSDIGQVTYANSITFTPGTLTLDVYDHEISVHSLQPDSVQTLRAGGMVRRVQRLEGSR